MIISSAKRKILHRRSKITSLRMAELEQASEINRLKDEADDKHEAMRLLQ
jgi:hypothetical protein